MTQGAQAVLTLLAACLGWFATLHATRYLPGMSLDKFRPALETAAWSTFGAMLPLLPDLLADEPVLTPRAFARMAVSAFVTALASRFVPSKTAPKADP